MCFFHFPVFNKYYLYEIKKIDIENVAEAERVIEEINTKYFRSYHIANDMCNFINLVRLLVNGKVIKQIKVFIKLLPTDIKILFNDIIAKAENLDPSDPYMIVLSLKAILQFKQIFENRYNEIRNNNWYASSCSLSRNEIEQQISKCYEEYSSVDESSIFTYNYKVFKEMECAAQDIQLEQKPEQKSDVFLYIEKSAPIPKDHNFKPKYV